MLGRYWWFTCVYIYIYKYILSPCKNPFSFRERKFAANCPHVKLTYTYVLSLHDSPSRDAGRGLVVSGTLYRPPKIHFFFLGSA